MYAGDQAQNSNHASVLEISLSKNLIIDIHTSSLHQICQFQVYRAMYVGVQARNSNQMAMKFQLAFKKMIFLNE